MDQMATTDTVPSVVAGEPEVLEAVRSCWSAMGRSILTVELTCLEGYLEEREPVKSPKRTMSFR